ncbi:MAG: class I SAM-dependent DNA methyltransferase, partial [Flavobacteriales bacterium]|nr:class I SAM-dependent DNA methyltransferase [Flavobacteriales bacterium]
MPLSRIEIRRRATAFTKAWAEASDEHAEAKSFWDGFFQVFGVDRRRVATFEHHVKKLGGADGFVDLFWPGKLVVEHKSRGKNLDKAHGQAMDYLHGLPDHQLPRFIITSDFARIRVYDLEEKHEATITLDELPRHIELFDFISGWSAPKPLEQDPVNRRAAELMARLH